MKTNLYRFKLYIISMFFLFTGLISLSIGFKDTIEVQAGTIPDGYATDPINAAADELVWIPDQNLRRFLETKVGVGVNADITVQHMRNITTNSWRDMNLNHKSISDLIGLEFATNIRHLTLSDNQIADISPLSDMTNLNRVNLSNNEISFATSNTLKSITKLFEGESSQSKSLYELELVPTDSAFFDESGKAIRPGTTTAYIKIKEAADSNTYTRTLNVVPITISDKIVSNNDIKVELTLNDSLEVMLGSDTINFGEVSSVGGEVQSTTLTVSSSLPYDISTKAYGDLIGNIDEGNIIPINKISLDIDGQGYNALLKVKTLNIGGSPKGINKVHNLSFKMGDTLGYKIDNYTTSIQFVVDAN